MDTETIRLLLVAAAVSLVMHSLVRHYGWACLVTTLVAPLLYAVESFIRLHLPPSKLARLPMVYPFFMLCSLGPALLIGLPFFVWRRYLRNGR